MKKMVALILLLCSLCATCNANAEKLTVEQFDALIPDSTNIDFTAFVGSDVYFDNFTFSGYIDPKVSFQLKNFTVYIRINYFAQDSVIHVEPVWFSYAKNSNHYDFFVVMGQNRYRIQKDELSAPLGQDGFNLLKEMAEYDGPVQIASQYDYECYTLTDTDRMLLRKFIAHCELSGIVSQFPQDGNVIIITQFN